jgi:hypothetical protein
MTRIEKLENPSANHRLKRGFHESFDGVRKLPHSTSIKLVLIGYPFSYAEQKESTVPFYEEGTLKAEITVPKIIASEVFIYLKDSLANFYFFQTKIQVSPFQNLWGLR